MGLWKLVWILFLMFSQMPGFVDGTVSVHFKIGRQLQVAVGQTLVLEAELKQNQDDKIDMVTWECERGTENVRISQNDRISLEKDDSLLRIKHVRPEDFGTYKITVTDSDGQQEHASIEVKKMDEPPKASVASVLECFVEVIGVTQWDSPQFTWVVDDVVVTDQMALMDNGKRLNISEVKGRNYTCVISSSLGISVTHYQTITESQPCSKYGGLVIGLFFALVVCLVGGFFIWKYYKTRRRRVPVDDPNEQ
ncbi:uncharacterized protein LOC130557537 [Triplophysa rosa]|uniref:Ig-like domain-containing protein n=1 Tax=Triplophysa rosa TaxID=992332 RepID=A0A9W8C2G1_TRIRA|nr:uncharacterized protein LOC130557537 [Triplophysa rosa]KAI7806155.1 hypothetical protein IRJ41_001309 [Triplophysa rosa]